MTSSSPYSPMNLAKVAYAITSHRSQDGGQPADTTLTIGFLGHAPAEPPPHRYHAAQEIVLAGSQRALATATRPPGADRRHPAHTPH